MNKIFVILITLCGIINVYPQIYQKYDDGTVILISLKTTSPVTKSDFGDKLRMWQVRIPNTNKLLRYVTNENGGYCVGYTLEFENLNGNQFKVSIKPPDDSEYEFPFKEKFELRKLNKYPKEILINDGDAIVLDLLENSSKDVKAQDMIMITKKPLADRNYFGDLEKPKDFGTNDIKLNLTEFEVSLNGEKLKQKSLYDVSGHILVFHFKNRGKIFLSLLPQKEFNFQKVGTISGKYMSFKINNDSYQIISSSYIWNDEEVKWNLWGYYIPEEKLKEKIPDSLDYKGQTINSLTSSELQE